MPADTLTVSRATNGRVLVTYFCYSKASTRGPEDINIVDRIMNGLVYSFFSSLLFRENNCIRLFKSPCFWGLLLFSSFKRAGRVSVGKYKVTLPDVLASRFILIHTSRLSIHNTS